MMPDIEKCCSSMRATPNQIGRNRARGSCGILLILIGILWFAGVAGWFRPDFLWPLVVMTIGIWMVVRSIVRRKRKHTCEPDD